MWQYLDWLWLCGISIIIFNMIFVARETPCHIYVFVGLVVVWEVHDELHIKAMSPPYTLHAYFRPFFCLSISDKNSTITIIILWYTYKSITVLRLCIATFIILLCHLITIIFFWSIFLVTAIIVEMYVWKNMFMCL